MAKEFFRNPCRVPNQILIREAAGSTYLELIRKNT